MKTVLLLRHAKSAWDDPGLTDHDRPLNRRGQRDAPQMGQLIQAQGLTPDVIVSSTAARAHGTAERVARQCGYRGQIELAPSLYQATARHYLGHLQQLPDECSRVLVVGHNPGLEELLELVTGSYERLPTAALAQVSFDIGSWRDLAWTPTGQLVQVWRPKELGE